MTRKPPPHRRPRDPFRTAQRAPQIRQPGPSPLAAEMAEWAVRHPGIRNPIPYANEAEARVAAGTAGQVLHHGKEVP